MAGRLSAAASSGVSLSKPLAASSRGVWLSITPTSYQVAKYKWQGERADLMCRTFLGSLSILLISILRKPEDVKTTLKTRENLLSGPGTDY